MKKYIVLIIFAAVISINLQGMIPSNFQEFPNEIKREIVLHLYDQDNVEDIIKSFNTLKLVDLAFYNLISTDERINAIFKLAKTDNLLDAFEIFKKNPTLFKKTNVGRYLNKKFTNLNVTAQDYNAIIPLLLDKAKADRYRKNYERFGASLGQLLLDAIGNNDMKSVVELLALGVDPNGIYRSSAPWYLDVTPLMYASFTNKIQMMKFFLELGVDIKKKNRQGWDVNHWAVRNPQMMELLRKYKSRSKID